MSLGDASVLSFTWVVGCLIACVICLRRPPTPVSAVALGGVALLLRVVPLVLFRLPADAGVQFDIESYRIVGHLLRTGQDVYSHTSRHPYLPLQMYVIAAASWAAERSAVSFELLVKLPAAMADALIPIVISRWVTPTVSRARAAHAALAYATNPLSIFAVCVHGQFDSLPLLFVMLSLVLLRSRVAPPRVVMTAGVLFGLAVLEKTWPVLILPLAVSHVDGWRSRLLLMMSAALVLVAGTSVYCALVGASPGPLLDTVRGYSGLRDSWGYPLLLNRFGHVIKWIEVLREWIVPVEPFILAAALIVATILAVPMSVEQGGVLVLFAFYAFTYGWGAHYLTWIVPFLLLAGQGAVSLGYLIGATVTTMVLFYGYGGISFGLLRDLRLDSPIIRFAFVIPVPLWILCLVGLLVFVRRRSEPGYRRAR
jgi:hypothetical protein